MANIKVRGIDQTTGQVKTMATGDVAVDGAGDSVAPLSQVVSADLVADDNVALTGEIAIDGVTTSTSTVLCVAQTTGSQNGLYTTAAGAWSRVTLTTNAHLASFISRGIEVQIGKSGDSYGLNSLGGLRYRIQPSSTAATLGSDNLVFQVVPGSYNLLDALVVGSPVAYYEITGIPVIAGANLIIDIAGQTTHSGTVYTVLYLSTGGSLDITTTNYYSRQVYTWAGSVSAADSNTPMITPPLTTTSLDSRGVGQIRINNYSDAITRTTALSFACYAENDTTGGLVPNIMALTWSNTGAIDGLRLYCSTGSWEIGSSLKVYIER